MRWCRYTSLKLALPGAKVTVLIPFAEATLIIDSLPQDRGLLVLQRSFDKCLATIEVVSLRPLYSSRIVLPLSCCRSTSQRHAMLLCTNHTHVAFELHCQKSLNATSSILSPDSCRVQMQMEPFSVFNQDMSSRQATCFLAPALFVIYLHHPPSSYASTTASASPPVSTPLASSA